MSELLDIWRRYYDARETSVTIFNIVGKLGNFQNAKRPLEPRQRVTTMLQNTGDCVMIHNVTQLRREYVYFEYTKVSRKLCRNAR